MTNGSRLAVIIVILGVIVALLALKFRIFAPLEMPRPASGPASISISIPGLAQPT